MIKGIEENDTQNPYTGASLVSVKQKQQQETRFRKQTKKQQMFSFKKVILNV